MEHLRVLCGILDLSVDEAISGEPTEAKTAQEALLLEMFRNADELGREFMLMAAKQAGRR